MAHALVDYMGRARSKAVIDYGFHPILSEATPAILKHARPQASAEASPSLRCTWRTKRKSWTTTSREGALLAAPGQGQFIARQCSEPVATNAQQPNPSRAAQWLGLKGKAWVG